MGTSEQSTRHSPDSDACECTAGRRPTRAGEQSIVGPGLPNWAKQQMAEERELLRHLRQLIAMAWLRISRGVRSYALLTEDFGRVSRRPDDNPLLQICRRVARR